MPMPDSISAVFYSEYKGKTLRLYKKYVSVTDPISRTFSKESTREAIVLEFVH